MNVLKIIGVLVVFFLTFSSSQSQVLKNNGAPVFLKSGSTMTINGNGENATGSITIQENAELFINGNFTVSADTVRFENTSLGIITGNMLLAYGSVFYRNPGSLSVFGNFYNSGMLFNLGGIIEIGIP